MLYDFYISFWGKENKLSGKCYFPISKWKKECSFAIFQNLFLLKIIDYKNSGTSIYKGKVEIKNKNAVL